MEKYITKQEFRAMKGIDLDIELKDLDDGSNKARRFIRQVTDWCSEYLQSKFRAFELESWPDEGDPTDAIITEKRQRLFREGVAEQMDYILSNGDIRNSAGINIDTGIITDMSKVELSRAARNKFHLAGFCNI